MNIPRVACSLLLLVPALGCNGAVGTGDGTATTATDSTDLALVSSTGVTGVLRRGETLSVSSRDLDLMPSTIYRARVLDRDEILSETDVVTDSSGQVQLSALMHDVGEGDSAQPGDRLDVRLIDPFGDLAAETVLALDAPPALQVPGWNVDEVQPPHIWATDGSGDPRNAYAVGGADPGETVGPVRVAGEGFPDAVAGGSVDVYVMHDRDEWRGRDIPTDGEDYVAGPIEAPVDTEGRIVPTEVFTPTVDDVGIYDILVDVDRDGRFEWTFDSKDGADGLGKVGFTIQYSQQWLRERTSRHILVNIAYDSHSRGAGSWRNSFHDGQPVFLYLNPPVMHQYHFNVTKVIVAHQDFDTFWNDPARVDPSCGGVPYEEHETVSMSIVTERGCTNTGPTCVGPLDLPPADGDGTTAEETATFDVVFDRDGDGCYDVGEDLLDIVSTDTGGGLVPVDVFQALPPEQRVGFTVLR